MLALIVITIAVIVVFDYTNGFHDASNIVATVIASRALSPVKAVCLVAVFEFLGPLLAGTAVADTIGGFVHLEGIAVRGALVIVTCASAMTLGILSGGWRIVRTVGFGIYKLGPLHAVDAQLTAGAVIFGSAMAGAPVSTTHVVSSSIMGIGASEHLRAVRWQKAKEIVGAWLVTIPGAGLMAAAFCAAARYLISFL